MSSVERQANPAMSSAAPLTATTTPRFTTDRLRLCDQSSSPDEPQQYVRRRTRSHRIARKSCLALTGQHDTRRVNVPSAVKLAASVRKPVAVPEMTNVG